MRHVSEALEENRVWFEWVYERCEFSEFDSEYRFKYDIKELKNPEFNWYIAIIKTNLTEQTRIKLKSKAKNGSK